MSWTDYAAQALRDLERADKKRGRLAALALQADTPTEREAALQAMAELEPDVVAEIRAAEEEGRLYQNQMAAEERRLKRNRDDVHWAARRRRRCGA